MAFRHARQAYVSVAGNDISAYCDDASLNIDTDTAETSSFGSTYKSSLAGLSGGTFNISGSYDPSATAPPAVLFTNLRASVAVVYREGGTASGQLQQAFNAIITSVQVQSSVSDRVTFTADMIIDGAVTFTTQ